MTALQLDPFLEILDGEFLAIDAQPPGFAAAGNWRPGSRTRSGAMTTPIMMMATVRTMVTCLRSRSRRATCFLVITSWFIFLI
ncbi:MAG: hypothetical protein M0C28_29820 [Candidatus Moduliflexus flocculans]|nr:hypothetical protein [Candidatus Moduliflexus flocculans]